MGAASDGLFVAPVAAAAAVPAAAGTPAIGSS